MELNHINLVVKDVNRAIELFHKHLDFELVTNRNGKMAVMQNNRNFALVIWGQVLNNEDKLPDYPANFHIGFYQEDEAAVHQVFNNIKNEAYVVMDGEPRKIRNTFGFYFYYENLMIEISINPFSTNASKPVDFNEPLA
ncbi:VOC family protein [Pedobacter suwonensis]|uniref:VOC family protein n=1 Tax=Pedobacter suwonensis TaxID=332999 RepID=UPI0025E6D9AB|nr:VOC family protein [uncultured Pedobacter sp.]